MNFITGKSVAFVAQAPIIEGKGLGAEIDSFDLVYRTNLYPMSNTADYGERCDIISVVKDNFPFIGRHNVQHIVHFDKISYKHRAGDQRRNHYFINERERKLIVEWCKIKFHVDIIDPTAGLVAWFLMHIYKAERIKFFGMTGYQNKHRQVVNHGEEKHYVDEYIDELKVRERLHKAQMATYDCHDFKAHNAVWRGLIREGLVDMDDYSWEYFN